jgi:type VI secretion system secreted protein VgrG
MWNWFVNLFKKAPPPIVAEPHPAVVDTPNNQEVPDHEALAYTFKNEGGFTNVKEDKGGPTKYGITISTLTRWRKKTVTAEDVRQLNILEAEAIYKAWYWNPINLDKIDNERVAMALFDRAVLNGLEGVSTHVENVLAEPHDASHNFDKCIDKVNQTNPVAFVMRLADQCEAAHRRNVAANPSQARFLKGWLNRVNRMRKELGDGTVKAI